LGIFYRDRCDGCLGLEDLRAEAQSRLACIASKD
jgi:hypothetical protein